MSAGIQNYDIVVTGKGREFHISQEVDGQRQTLEGPHDHEHAIARALVLADEHGADAWVEEAPGVFRSLND